MFPQPEESIPATSKRKQAMPAITQDIVNCPSPAHLAYLGSIAPADPGPAMAGCRPSLFKLIHGIVRQIDSLRRGRAQHMKSYGQIIEISC
jgi:hypothetical protein